MYLQIIPGKPPWLASNLDSNALRGPKLALLLGFVRLEICLAQSAVHPSAGQVQGGAPLVVCLLVY